uniref:Putative secreted protein n=1 Tax=Ixodes scapularis TaxID=6945 RepID=A0A4D5RCT8_IXOSC
MLWCCWLLAVFTNSISSPILLSHAAGRVRTASFHIINFTRSSLSASEVSVSNLHITNAALTPNMSWTYINILREQRRSALIEMLHFK